MKNNYKTTIKIKEILLENIQKKKNTSNDINMQ